MVEVPMISLTHSWLINRDDVSRVSIGTCMCPGMTVHCIDYESWEIYLSGQLSD